jgi:hypothetical protein
MLRSVSEQLRPNSCTDIELSNFLAKVSSYGRALWQEAHLGEIISTFPLSSWKLLGDSFDKDPELGIACNDTVTAMAAEALL